MPINPIITFKAGQCEVDTSEKPYKVKPQPEPGYIYLYSEDDLVHFCWRKRSTPLDEPELDLMMVPSDGSFVPYEYTTSPQPTSKTNGRIFALKFSSSSQRYLFWMQSKSQARNGDPSYFSPRDRKIGTVIHKLLQGDEIDVTRELANINNSDDRSDDGDEFMEDVEGQRDQHDHHGGGSGGAGPDATGGDIREEGENSREGGADGARAASASTADAAAAAAVRNFLDSLKGQPGMQAGNSGNVEKAYPYLHHLMPSSVTVPLMDSASEELMDSLISFLPPAVVVLASGSPDDYDGKGEPSAASIEAAKASLSLDDKRTLLKKVLRSPQFHQALGSLTMALRDGGLPTIADALGVKVQNGGYLQGGGMPMGGNQAVEAFVEGVKKSVQEEQK